MQILNRYYLLILGILFILPNLVWSEVIVNIEDLRKEGQVGFFSSLTMAINGSRGNIDRDFYSASFRVDKNSESLESFVILQKSKRKNNGRVLNDSTFFHGRLIFINETKYSTELFIQQGKNPFRRYTKRDVLGIGTRVTLNESSRLGIGVLTENEKDIENVSQQTERFAAYYHDDFELGENIDLNTTIYYQPSLDNFDDFIKETNDKLNISGLMCIPPKTEDPEIYFAFLKQMAQKINLKKLSMGMKQYFLAQLGQH